MLLGKKILAALSLAFALCTTAQAQSGDEYTRWLEASQASDEAGQTTNEFVSAMGYADTSKYGVMSAGNIVALSGEGDNLVLYVLQQVQSRENQAGNLNREALSNYWTNYPYARNLQVQACSVAKDALSYVSIGLSLVDLDKSLSNAWDFKNRFQTIQGKINRFRELLGCDAPQNTGFDGRYGTHIKNVGSNFCLNQQRFDWELPNSIYNCDNHPDQIYDITRIEGNYFQIRSPKWNNCLNVQDSYDFKETNVYGCNVHPDQEWNFRPAANGAYQIESRRAPGKCLSLNQYYNGATTVIKSCNSSDFAQLWTLY